MYLKKVIIFILSFIGVSQVGSAVYMVCKAELSRYLISESWSQSLKDKLVHKPWSWADTYPVARLFIPSLEKETYVLEGSSGRNLAFSATHLPQSGMPGENKSIIISGHNDSHFSYLDEISIGQKIILETVSGNNSFIVTDIRVTDSRRNKVQIKDSSELILTTCYPFNSLTTGGYLRYVVYAKPFRGENNFQPKSKFSI